MSTSQWFRLLFFTLLSSAQNAPVLNSIDLERRPLARVGEQLIYEADLLPSIGAQLLQLRNQEYELKLRALRSVVSQRLLALEAQKAGISTEAFLAERVDRLLVAPLDREIDAFYLAQKDRIDRPLAEVREPLRAALVQARRQQARQEFLDRLCQNPTVSLLLDRPRVSVRADPLRVRGPAAAPVTIVEFSDFQCPYCREIQSVVNGLLRKYPGQVRLAFRDFPLRPIHPHAQKAAEASRCAGDQGKFWEYHDLLFQNQSLLDSPSLKGYAASLGLEPQRFAACIDGGRFTAAVDADLQAGSASGVAATPTFFVNGALVAGAQSATAFESLIESELTRPPARGTAP